MKIDFFGLDVTPKALQAVSDGGRGWWPIVREPYTGAWQQNIQIDTNTALAYSAVFACINRIASDIAKLRVRLVMLDEQTKIWVETKSSAFSPVLRKPNHFQNRVKFFEYWFISKLTHGNMYALKQRDNRGVVTALYILNPLGVRPLISPDGSVFYELKPDALSRQEFEVIVPAREIIHDPAVCLFHPLIGVSPLFASGLAAAQGLKIQTNSARFFANNSNPGGVLTAPGPISDATAQRLKTHWDSNYGGDKAGAVAVLGDGLTYQPMSVNAANSQLIEQLKWTAENVCTAFNVPPFMIGVGPMPAFNNIEALTQQYYATCLQTLIESAEIALDEGLELPEPYGTEFDLKALLRMDTLSRFASHTAGISGGWKSQNEVRADEDLPPVEGGEFPMMQQQYWTLPQLAQRPLDALATPAAPAAAPAPAGEGEDVESDEDSNSEEETDEEEPTNEDDEALEMAVTFVKGLTEGDEVPNAQ